MVVVAVQVVTKQKLIELYDTRMTYSRSFANSMSMSWLSK